MKFLARLEKTKILWLSVTLCLFFFLLRFPSLIEPYWYGDEGVYEIVGVAMNHGSLLYRDIWDNKPPLLYIVYALSQGDQQTVKILSLIGGLLSIVVFFLLSQKLFNKMRISMITTALYVLLLGTPILEGNIANAEDFILLPIILAGLLIYHLTVNTILKNTRYLFLSGLLLGIAFLFKIVAVFDFAAFLTFFIILNLPKNLSLPLHKNKLWMKILIPNSLPTILGFLLPLFITALYFTFNNALGDFLQAVFFGNIGYVGWQNNLLGIPQGFLLIKCFLLAFVIFIIFQKRQQFTKPILFITIWLIFSLFNCYFSGRPYTHYALVLLPSFCLFVGLLLESKKTKIRLKITIGILAIIILVTMQFPINMPKSYLYYQNVIQFIIGQKSVEAYQSFFDPKTPRDYAVASFIIKNTKPSDKIFIWGNNAQIYSLSHKLPLGKYTVAYHIIQNNALNQTQQIINHKQPKYIILLKESEPLPFDIPLYIMRYSTSGAIIYERNH